MPQLLTSAKSTQDVNPARRMFLELRNIRLPAVSYVTAAPLGDCADKILASIEGPPGTPYEGGIFWLTALLVPGKPPLLYFHTRIYHWNIDHTGKICVDYGSWLRDSSRMNKHPSFQRMQTQLPWFSEHVTKHYNLGALLVAACGLLASPNVEDPLVPEIAEKYITDYEGYCAAARMYTKRYASPHRPAEETLVFRDAETEDAGEIFVVPEYQPKQISASIVNFRPPIEDPDYFAVSVPKVFRMVERQISHDAIKDQRDPRCSLKDGHIAFTRGELKCLLQQLLNQMTLDSDLLAHLQQSFERCNFNLVAVASVADWCYEYDSCNLSPSERDQQEFAKTRKKVTEQWGDMFQELKFFLHDYVMGDNYAESRSSGCLPYDLFPRIR
ncbi:putative Prion-inhibition and propagation-domain-containing protein [Seiridium unicorne]|uniref:Prion-inhibition and propagation-domain-containing protein n=1 Tax=Seiridium unicorne TaxID=138068 RepID=A0ABR2UED9_9PEZI